MSSPSRDRADRADRAIDRLVSGRAAQRFAELDDGERRAERELALRGLGARASRRARWTAAAFALAASAVLAAAAWFAFATSETRPADLLAGEPRAWRPDAPRGDGSSGFRPAEPIQLSLRPSRPAQVAVLWIEGPRVQVVAAADGAAWRALAANVDADLLAPDAAITADTTIGSHHFVVLLAASEGDRVALDGLARELEDELRAGSTVHDALESRADRALAFRVVPVVVERRRE